MIRVRMTGGREAQRRLQQIARRSPQAVRRAMYKVAQEIMREAKKITPVDTGVLRASGKVDKPTITGKGVVTQRLGFGGPAIKYAIVQHERLDYRHKAPQQAKYLETPAVRMAPKVHAQIVIELNEEVRRAT